MAYKECTTYGRHMGSYYFEDRATYPSEEDDLRYQYLTEMTPVAEAISDLDDRHYRQIASQAMFSYVKE